MRKTQSPSQLRVDAIVLRADRGLVCEAVPTREPGHSLVMHAFESYGFILKSLNVERPMRLTLKEFAEHIGKVYCVSEPRHRLVVDALECAHDDLVQLVATSAPPVA